ncbi:MAG TPA: hypothetical protein VKS79_23600 [Gemmataceae bacterium]|nr:hypothetical protein [Gemmataceae bacterium]
MFHRTLALAASLLFLMAASRADETYTIKVNRDDKGGEKYHLSMTEKGGHNIVVTGADGGVLNEDNQAVDKSVVLEKTILLVKTGQKRPEKVAVKFIKVHDNKNGDYGLTGKTVLAELKDKKYECKIEGGGELSEAALKLLKSDILKEEDEGPDFEELALPGKPVAIGETWKCKMGEITKEMERKMQGMKLDADKAKGTGKLTKVYKKDGRTFGQFEITIEMPLAKSATVNGVDFNFKEGSKFKVALNFDGCIDGSAQEGTMAAKMDFTMKGNITANGMELPITGTGDSKLSEERKDLTGK